MKNTPWSIPLSPFLALLSFTTFAQQPTSEISPFAIVERGDHHRVWQSVTAETNDAGKTRYRTNSYIELQTGMNVKQPDGSYAEASEEIEITADGALARQGRHQVIFSSNCNSPVAIDMLTPDGKRFQSRVMGLAYFDRASGQSVLIAELQDSVGQILSRNQVIYLDAFKGFKAHIRYTYTKAGFEQDIILRQQPPSPKDFGLDPATTTIQVLTEFFDPPVPVKEQRTVNGLTDEMLSFGDMRAGQGKAFSLLDGTRDRNSIPVAKSWITLESRVFLVEEVPFQLIQPKLETLPKTAAIKVAPGGVLHTVSAQRLLPTIKLAKKANQPMQVASMSLIDQGVVLDYTLLSGGTNYVFQGDKTYYVNGEAIFTGNVIFEGGTVLKFSSTNYSTLVVNGGTVTCQTAPYRPAVFTSRNDNTVGETISGSTGTPVIDTQGNYSLVINSTNQTTLQHLRISYCYSGVTAVNGSLNLSHVQFVHAAYPVFISSTTHCNVRNALMNDVTGIAFEVYNAAVAVEHLTLNQCVYLGANDSNATLGLTNSLLVGVQSMGDIPYTTNSVAVLSANATVFQTVGAASHYLTNDTYRNAGTTNINATLLSGLKQRTTYPPIELTTDFTLDTTLLPQAQRDTDTPDLGYHYDPLDYVVSGRTLTNSTLTLTNGVAVGTYGSSSSYGIYIRKSGNLVSEGSPTNLNQIVRYNTVQEQANTNWSASTVAHNIKISTDGATVPKGSFRFTGWSLLGGKGYHFYASYPSITTPFSFKDCQFGPGYFEAAQCSAALTNCLLDRSTVNLDDDGGDYNYYGYNNLFRVGSLSVYKGGSGTWILKDNLFDRTTNSQSGTITHSNNAYISGYNRLTPTNANDVVLTNAPTYLTNWLGKYYYPTNDGMLSLLLNVGVDPV